MTKGQQGAVLRHVQALFKAGRSGDLTDEQLLERFTARDGDAAELAFATLVERHGPMVLRTCRAILRDPHEAHDAFQATFLVLVRRAGSLRVHDSLGAWLHQVAYRTACCARSAAARRRKHEQKASEPVARSARFDGWDDLGEVLHEEVDRLPERYRMAVVLCLVEGLTHEQAARRLGWPIGTVQSRLARGRDRLRTRLTRRGLAPMIGAAGATFSAATARAAVPASLAGATIQAALRFYAGQTTVAGAVSAAALTLTEGASRMMFITRLKLTAMALLLAGFAATGAGVWAGQKARQVDEPARSAQQPAEEAPAIVARVDGTPITRDQLIERCLAKYGAKELDALIDLAILRAACRRRGIEVTDDEVEAEAVRIARGFGIAPADWYRTLEEQRGWSKDQYLRDVVRPSLMSRELAGGPGPGTRLEELRRRAKVEVYLGRPRNRPAAEKEPRARTQSEESGLD
jgi:RNA polymerase sigma factor (sigma-70 family)